MIDTNEKKPTQIIQAIFKALGNEKRHKIFTLLMTGSHCNCELAEALGVPLNLVSHHIHILIDLGLVTTQRDETDARWIYYSIDQRVLENFRETFMTVTNPEKIQNRSLACPPKCK